VLSLKKSLHLEVENVKIITVVLLHIFHKEPTLEKVSMVDPPTPMRRVHCIGTHGMGAFCQTQCPPASSFHGFREKVINQMSG
jgi:hypothetical protein